MQQSRSEMEQLWEDWTTVPDQVYSNPKVTLLMNSRVGQYLSGRPVLALAVVFFGVMAVVPVGLFLVFAVTTTIMSAVSLLLLEGFLLSVAAITLLCVLSGLAFFSVMVSAISAAFYLTVSSLLYFYQTSQLTKEVKEEENEEEILTKDEMK
ncbi:lipid droplet assembly factor 1-like isoform X2 [Nerophis ophidion]|uniref:lipid droplet assembly factor 1-like isoform X2 n=1 Tax=Nerophis ophidion TaxID=159077 RepID=UPI002ADFE747|nr:lipid droplet assembly factor 1-like isoform X2 [Nerophis ophidion]XP_061740672.1 lipid droplet assembly factor 1-like isoform X2 [Nerophis ophidion]